MILQSASRWQRFLEDRQRAAQHRLHRLQAAVWVVMVSACLGVVLEGPMGAIPFWIMLGLAHQAATAGEPVTAPLPAAAPAV